MWWRDVAVQIDARYPLVMVIESAWTCSAPWGWFVALGIGGYVLFEALRFLSKAFVRKGNMPVKRLVAGPIALRGIVRSSAVEVASMRVSQLGKIAEGAPDIVLNEEERTVSLEPFELEVATSDGPIRVTVSTRSPSARVQIDAPLKTELVGLVRFRVASVHSGDNVLVRGVLTTQSEPASSESGYRRLPEDWVLAVDNGSISFVESADKRVADYRTNAVLGLLCVGVFVFAQLILLFNFYDMYLWGHPVRGFVESRDSVRTATWTRWGHPSARFQYFVTVRLEPQSRQPGGFTWHRTEVSQDTFFRSSVGDVAPALVNRGTGRLQLGNAPNINFFVLILLATGQLLLMFLIRWQARWSLGR